MQNGRPGALLTKAVRTLGDRATSYPAADETAVKSR
jgi:hypothetical protein